MNNPVACVSGTSHSSIWNFCELTPDFLTRGFHVTGDLPGRGDQVTHAGGGPDPRELPPKGLRTRDIYVPDLRIDTIKVKARDFR